MKRILAAAALAIPLLTVAPGCSRHPPDDTPTGPAMLIEPNLGVGPIRAEMTVDQVKQVLGNPERTTTNSLNYPRLGLATLSDADHIVRVVMCGDVTGLGGPYTKFFTGRTKEGIGMLSTREDILKAYGEPTEARRFGAGGESLKYDSLGITFTLQAGKVHHMIVRLGGEPPPATPPGTVTIDLGTTPPR